MSDNGTFTAEQAKELQPLLAKFLASYDTAAQNPEWLVDSLQAEQPEKSTEEIGKLAEDIRTSVGIWEENMASLNNACAEGISKEFPCL